MKIFDIVIIAFAVLMMVGAYFRGIKKLVYSVIAMLTALILCISFQHPLKQSMYNQEDIRDGNIASLGNWLARQYKSYALSYDEVRPELDLMSTEEQAAFIDTLPLPAAIRNKLTEYNTPYGYERYKAAGFSDYLLASIVHLNFEAIAALIIIVLGYMVTIMILNIIRLDTLIPGLAKTSNFYACPVSLLETLFVTWLIYLILIFGLTNHQSVEVLKLVKQGPVSDTLFSISPFTQLLFRLP